MKGIIYHGEGQLCSWSETSTRGSMVTFWLPDSESLEPFKALPSCYSGDYSEYLNGEGRCEYAHVRRAGMSGTGYKPPYMGVPLTHAEHALQHQKGYGALHEGGIDWFEKQAVMYRTNWVKDWLRNHFCSNLYAMLNRPYSWPKCNH